MEKVSKEMDTKKEEDDDGGCQGRKTHSLSAGCRPERRRESVLSLCLKVTGGRREKGDGDKKGGERERKKTDCSERKKRANDKDMRRKRGSSNFVSTRWQQLLYH